MLQAVFDTLLARPWFHRNAVTEKELAKLLIVAFRDGRTESADLLHFVESEARRRFSSTPE